MKNKEKICRGQNKKLLIL